MAAGEPQMLATSNVWGVDCGCSSPSCTVVLSAADIDGPLKVVSLGIVKYARLLCVSGKPTALYDVWTSRLDYTNNIHVHATRVSALLDNRQKPLSSTGYMAYSGADRTNSRNAVIYSLRVVVTQLFCHSIHQWWCALSKSTLTILGWWIWEIG